MSKRQKYKTPFEVEVDKFVGQLIRATRLHKKVTQAGLATVVNVSFQQIQKYEKGENRVSVPRIILICQGLDCDPIAFMKRLVYLIEGGGE